MSGFCAIFMGKTLKHKESIHNTFVKWPMRDMEIHFLMVQGDSGATPVKEMRPGTPWQGQSPRSASPNFMAFDPQGGWSAY